MSFYDKEDYFTDDDIEREAAEPNMYKATYEEMKDYYKKWVPKKYEEAETVESITKVRDADFHQNWMGSFHDYTIGQRYAPRVGDCFTTIVKFEEYDTEIRFLAFWSRQENDFFPGDMPPEHLSDSCHICKHFKGSNYKDGSAKEYPNQYCVLQFVDLKRIFAEVKEINKLQFMVLAEERHGEEYVEPE